MVRENHHNNIKRGDVCTFAMESLPDRNFSSSYLSKCVTLEVTISNKNGYVITLYTTLYVITNVSLLSVI